VQARSGGVESDVERDRARVQVLAQLVQVGGVLQQATPEQVVDYLGHAVIVAHRVRPGHGLRLPGATARRGKRVGKRH
jgi:hypothetical protein